MLKTSLPFPIASVNTSLFDSTKYTHYRTVLCRHTLLTLIFRTLKHNSINHYTPIPMYDNCNRSTPDVQHNESGILGYHLSWQRDEKIRPIYLQHVPLFLQESQCQTLPSPCVSGYKHGSLVRLVRVREQGRPEPVLQTGVGKSAPVGRVSETLSPTPSPSSSSPGRQAQGHRGLLVAPSGEHARRSRTGRQ